MTANRELRVTADRTYATYLATASTYADACDAYYATIIDASEVTAARDAYLAAARAYSDSFDALKVIICNAVNKRTIAEEEV